MTYKEIINDLKNKIYHPVYFLMGEEAYYIDKISDYIMNNVLDEGERSFNQTVLYGKDTNINDVINAAKRYPMMANQQVVIVKEAQHLKNLDNLVYYLEKPLKSTVLVINYKYKKLDKRKQLYKKLQKSALVFESPVIYDYKIPGWIEQYVKEHQCTIAHEASKLLTEYLGNDLNKVANELDKLISTLPPGEQKISIKHIEKNIGISKDYNTFELQKALCNKDILKCNRIVKYFGQNPNANPFPLIIASLYYFFSKLLGYYYIIEKMKDKSKNNIAALLKINPYFVRDYQMAAKVYDKRKVVCIIELLREYDTKSKGVGNVSAKQEDLLKEMVYRILH
jgi:DNA polymerase-3 subunit delta